jgi:hypothetical protein
LSRLSVLRLTILKLGFVPRHADPPGSSEDPRPTLSKMTNPGIDTLNWGDRESLEDH